MNHTIRKVDICTGTVTTIAGSAGKSGSTDGTGSAALFNEPFFITTDGTSLYIVDEQNSTVRKISGGPSGSGSEPGIDGGAIQGASDGGGSVSGLFTLTSTTPDSTNVAVGSYPSQKDGPGFGYEVISCSSGLIEIRYWCTADINGVSTLGNFQARWEWTGPPAEIRPGGVWPISGTATVVKNDGICTAGGEIATGAYFWPNDPASVGPTVSDANPAGFAKSEQAVGTCQTGAVDFDTNIGLGGSWVGCSFWYHYKWNP